MKVNVVTTSKEFLELEDNWKDIFNKCATANIFISWEWCSLWWKYYGENQKLFIITVEDKDEVVGIAPLMISKRSFFTLWKSAVCFLGGNIADYMDFLILRNNKEVVRIIIHYLANFADWGVIDLKRIPAYSPNFIPVKECISNLYYDSIVRISSQSHIVRIEKDWDDYYRTISKGIRQDIRTAHNKFKLLGEICFETYNENSSKELLTVLFELHKKRQIYKLGQSLFEAQTTRDFFYDFAVTLTKLRWTDISALSLNGRIISAVFAFKNKGVFYYWLPAFDPEFSKYSPGKVHIQALLKNAFDQQFKEFDLMRGDEAYKSNWSNNKFNTYELKIYKSNLYGKLDALIFISRHYLKELYNKYPLFKKMLIKISKI